MTGKFDRKFEVSTPASPELTLAGDDMAMHKFAIGQTIRFAPYRSDRHQLAPAQSRFKIVQLLPEAGNVFQYRVKSQADGHERVVREDQLIRS